MKKLTPMNELEIWGGIECTINRNEDIYKDQLTLSGHYNRAGDLEAFAGLGIKAIRYPVLWEKHCPEKNKKIDWSWSNQQLTKIRELNMTPIVGLLHHGSGPAHTSLADPGFPKLLADYAGKVASQFPWVEYYTPVNEPLTTARFSGLYGLWYPHATNEFNFLTMLLNQLEGIVLSMQAIRVINPAAKLVQTEDICKIHSTRKLKYQARFENHRRWITYDLLCGKVNELHPLWDHFIQNGIARLRLDFFLENVCIPDIAGFNYYVTSERYLDEQLDKFPSSSWGTNGKDAYADNAAVRFVKLAGITRLLTEAWERYRIPMAITEAHLNCTREDQLRWFKEIWDCCAGLCKEGVEIKAVTAWSLLGSYDWDKLLTSNVNNYETGVFDIKSKYRRPTAMVGLIQSLSTTGQYQHPLLEGKGWWHRHSPVPDTSCENNGDSVKPLLIIGENGSLSKAFKIICEQRGINYIIFSGQDIDITKKDAVKKLFCLIKPWGLINASEWVETDNYGTAVRECLAVNTTGRGLLAEQCKLRGIHFMHYSTEMAFIGNSGMQFTTSNEACPKMNGKTKLNCEQAIISANPNALIIRMSSFFEPRDKHNFGTPSLNAVSRDQTRTDVKDIIIPPTFIHDLVNTSLDLFIDGEAGSWHVSNTGSFTRFDFPDEVVEIEGHSTKNIIPLNINNIGWQGEEPFYNILAS